MPNAARRRFVLFALPAIVAMAIPILACGTAGSGAREPECESASTSDACQTCCSEHGHTGHMYSSFGEPPCECM